MEAQRKGSRKLLLAFVAALITVLLSATVGAAGNPVYADDPQPITPIGDPIKVNDYLTVVNYMTADGEGIARNIINGPPEPPPGYETDDAVTVLPAAAKMLDVPTYTWVFGCSAVSGAMIAGYYDRNGYPKMYTGPTAGGVMPMTNASWPTWSDGYKTYPNNPLIASHNGVDGRASKGSIDDYWVKYQSTTPDPYIGNWTQHVWGSAIGDYMKTSQSPFGNTDGETAFFTYISSPNKLTCSAMTTMDAGGGKKISEVDGTYGRKLFYQNKGYTVTECYNQKTDNNSGGFTLANFKAQIDAGRPVMVNLAGHTVAGVGYLVGSSTIYIHDTWDNLDHAMTWGTTYKGMELLSVSIVNIAPSAVPSPISPSGTISDKTPTYTWTKVSSATRYQYELMKGTSAIYTKTVSSSVCGAANCSHTPTTTLSSGAYKWRVRAEVSSAWKGWSPYKNFTLSDVPTPISPSGATTDTTPTFTWTKVSGATQYQFGVYTGSSLAYPMKTVASAACGSSATNCSNTPANVLSAGAHTWKVRAYVGGAWKAFSPLKSFTVSSGKPKAGFWESTTGDEFYVTADQSNVDNFAIYLSVTGCGNYKITHTPLVPISNKHFAFTGSFYGSGTFNTTASASGQDGLNNFYISGCGTVNGGPWNYTATWKNSNQPAALMAVVNFVEQLGMPDLRLPNSYRVVQIVTP